MANSSKNVLVGKPDVAGGVLVGPLGTVAPTDATTALNPAFKATGYISEDGLTETTERSTDKVKAWGGDTVKVLQTDFSVTYEFTFIETNSDVLKAVYGASNVTTTPATSTKGTLHAIKADSAMLPVQSFVFEMKDGNARVRIFVPQGQITEVGEVTYKDDEVIAYSVTVETFRDATLGAYSVKYVDDGVFSA